MTDLLNMLDRMKRPRLLISAARIGLPDYRREVQLPRHLGGSRIPRSAEALRHLMELEAEMNERRRGREASYSAARHVGLLIAMMAEARILRSTERAQADRIGQSDAAETQAGQRRHVAPAPA